MKKGKAMSGASEGRRDSAPSGRVVHLVVAMLAVGGYSLHRVWDMRTMMAEQDLFDPEIVKNLSEAEVVRRLAISGYDRGPFVTVSMANRLVALHAAVREGLLTQASRLMQEGRLKDAEKTLCKVKGIGPLVFKQFATLEGVAEGSDGG